jgi:ion channel-forming bestrophin family protein
MITRKYFRPDTSIRYSWKNLLISFICASLAYWSHFFLDDGKIVVPIGVVAILGTALAIILGFKNSSAYERWWEARQIWGGIVNESRTLTRQVLTIVDPLNVPPGLWEESVQVVNRQIAWINALRLQLRGITDAAQWKEHVARHLSENDFEFIMTKYNKVTHLAMLQGNQIKMMNARDVLDTFSYIQMDDTITRLTDLQGRCERIKSTPLPRPYDYYTMAFLNLFLFFFPFAFIQDLENLGETYLIFPITMLVGWMFYQIYVLGKVLSSPFENYNTDVAMSAICTIIEIDLKEVINEKNVPEPLQPVKGVLM